jgi:hypothetical protein
MEEGRDDYEKKMGGDLEDALLHLPVPDLMVAAPC